MTPHSFGKTYTNDVGDKRYELSNHLGNVLSVITDRKLIGGNSTITPKYTYPFDTTLEGWTNNNSSQPTPVNEGGRIKVTGNVNSIGIKRDVVLSLPGTYLFTVEVDKTAFTPNVSLWLTTSNDVLIHSYQVSGVGKKYITTAVTLDGSGTATYKLIVRRTTGTAATTEAPQTFYIDNVVISEITNTLTAGLQPDVVEYHDYDPFGMLINQRTKSESGGYRYGFNGKEKDDELKGEGNSYDFGARMYDPRIGRWSSPDAFENETPSWNPYRFAFNNPLTWIDSDGNREFPSYDAYTLYAKQKGIKVLSHQEMWRQGHWTESDRGGNAGGAHGASGVDKMTLVFKRAAFVNTRSLRSDQYVNLPQRKAYYKWADEYFSNKGFEVKWMSAAESTVGTLEMALYPAAEWLGFSDEKVKKFIKEGNKLILDDMISKVSDLNNMKKPLKGSDALKWDAQALADEQNLIQPLYEALDKDTVDKLQSNLEFKYHFVGSVTSAADRWAFGMKQMGYKNVTPEMMPKPNNDYNEVNLKLKDETPK